MTGGQRGGRGNTPGRRLKEARQESEELVVMPSDAGVC